MRRATTNAMSTAPELVLVARVPQSTIESIVPVPLESLDSFAEPEPSKGATIELASGRFVVVIHGLTTGRLSVHATPSDGDEAVEDFLRESGMPHEAIEWRRPLSLRR